MGSGSSSGKVKKFNKSSQIPSVQENIHEQKSHDPLFRPVRHKPNRRRNSVREDVFDLDTNIEEYSDIWDRDTKLSSTLQKALKSDGNKIEHHQREMFDTKLDKKNTTVFESVHIQSTIDTETHSIIHLSSSEKIDELIKNLNDIHTKLDDIIKHRTQQISNETESVLSHILNETQQKQQRLLNYAKDQQVQRDEKYRDLLEEYIAHLNELKAKELNDLQKQLEVFRDQILAESQVKIQTVNDQANIIKAKVLRDEQQKATEKIDAIMVQIQKISSDDKCQYLGSDIITKTNVITQANIGTKAPGQIHVFEVEQVQSRENNHSAKANTRKKETHKQQNSEKDIIK